MANEGYHEAIDELKDEELKDYLFTDKPIAHP